MKTNTALSRELVLHKHLNGVQLIEPSDDSLELSLGDMMGKHLSVYLLDLGHRALEFNDHQMSYLNIIHRKDLLGKTVEAICHNNNIIASVHDNNEVVFNKQKTLIFSEEIHAFDRPCHSLSVKMPWYDDTNRVIGLFGYSYFSDSHCGQSDNFDFAEVSNSFFEPHQKTLTAADAALKPFSTREVELINYLMRGKTLNECAQRLNISKRTAEHYFNNIKDKVSVKTRSEFVNYLLANGYTL